MKDPQIEFRQQARTAGILYTGNAWEAYERETFTGKADRFKTRNGLDIELTQFEKEYGRDAEKFVDQIRKIDPFTPLSSILMKWKYSSESVRDKWDVDVIPIELPQHPVEVVYMEMLFGSPRPEAKSVYGDIVFPEPELIHCMKMVEENAVQQRALFIDNISNWDLRWILKGTGSLDYEVNRHATELYAKIVLRDEEFFQKQK